MFLIVRRGCRDFAKLTGAVRAVLPDLARVFLGVLPSVSPQSVQELHLARRNLFGPESATKAINNNKTQDVSRLFDCKASSDHTVHWARNLRSSELL